MFNFQLLIINENGKHNLLGQTRPFIFYPKYGVHLDIFVISKITWL